MCYAPITLKKTPKTMFKQKEYRMLVVPCGKCLECLQRRSNAWFVRLLKEWEQSKSAHFLTLTYDESVIPYSDNGLMTLQYTDVQKWMKRLRKRHKSNAKIKYFTVGEYGTKTHRPHYHSIIYNADIDDINASWNHGFIHRGDVQEASLHYILKYTTKKALDFTVGEDPDDDRLKEKALMSKGLGLNYLTKQMIEYHKNDVSRPITLRGGQKIALPRYYQDKMFSDTEKAERTLIMQDYIDEKREEKLDPLHVQKIRKKESDRLKYQLLKTN